MDIPLTKGFIAIIDAEDFKLIQDFKWHASIAVTGSCYAAGSFPYPNSHGFKITSLHKFLTKAAMTDHKDGNSLNNRRENLRACTRAQNNSNSGPRKKNPLGLKGVTLTPNKTNPYVATIGIDRRYLGVFKTKEGAARRYDEEALKIHGEFARLNFPEVNHA